MLRRPVRFPKGLQAKGEPEIQTIRRNTNHMVAEVGAKAYEPQAPEPVEEPEYSIEAEDERVVVVVAVPRLDSAAAVSLEHSSRRLFLKADGAYALTVMLPHSVEKTGDPSHCVWGVERRAEISGLGPLAGCFLDLGSGLGLVGTASSRR